MHSQSRLLLEETCRGGRKADWKVCRDRLRRLNLGPRGNEAQTQSASFIISQDLTILKVEIILNRLNWAGKSLSTSDCCVKLPFLPQPV